MILRRFGIHDRGWLVAILIGVLVVSALEPYQVPGAPPRAPQNDFIRWAFQIPAFLAGIGLMMLIRGWGTRLLSGPGKWLMAFAVWQLVAASFGLKPTVSTILSLGFVSYVGVGAVLVGRQGWAAARGYLTLIMTFVMISSALLWVAGRGGDLRLNGILSHPNHLGGACGIALVLYLDRFLRGSLWTAPLFLLSAGLLYLTDSRTAMAGAAIGLLIVTAHFFPRFTIPGVVGVLITAAVLLTQTSFFTSEVEGLSRSGTETEFATLTGRTDIWAISIDGIEANPVTGYGPGTTTDLFAEIKPEDVLGDFEINHAHNLWFQLGLIGGIPSVLFVSFGFVGYLIGTRGHRIRDRDAIVAAIAIFGISEPVFAAEPTIFLIALSAAIASVGSAATEPDELRSARSGTLHLVGAAP